MKQQNIDLGALQARLTAARKANEAAHKAHLKAEAEFDRTNKEEKDALLALESATKTVLKGG